jgi:hypothetical protein
MDGNIFNSQGVHVAIVRGPSIFNLKGEKLYDLRGINIYKLSGELVGHLSSMTPISVWTRRRISSFPCPDLSDLPSSHGCLSHAGLAS